LKLVTTKHFFSYNKTFLVTTKLTQNCSGRQLRDRNREPAQSLDGRAEGALLVGAAHRHEDVLAADQMQHEDVVQLKKVFYDCPGFSAILDYFSAKKWTFFSKNGHFSQKQCSNKNFALLSFVLSQKIHFCAVFFGEKV
jgi:hypothetical protein